MLSKLLLLDKTTSKTSVWISRNPFVYLEKENISISINSKEILIIYKQLQTDQIINQICIQMKNLKNTKNHKKLFFMQLHNQPFFYSFSYRIKKYDSGSNKKKKENLTINHGLFKLIMA